MKISLNRIKKDAKRSIENGKPIESVVKKLFDYGLEVNIVAKIMFSVDGLDMTGLEVVKVLKKIGIEEEKIALAIYLGPCFESYESTARALSEGIGLTPSEIAKVLHSKNGPNIKLHRIAKSLASYYGLNLPNKEVVRAMSEGIRVSAVEIATALKQGLGLKPHEIAAAICEGLDMTEEELAAFLKDTIDSEV